MNETRIWTSEDGKDWIDYDNFLDEYSLRIKGRPAEEMNSYGMYKTLKAAKAARTRMLKGISNSIRK